MLEMATLSNSLRTSCTGSARDGCCFAGLTASSNGLPGAADPPTGLANPSKSCSAENVGSGADVGAGATCDRDRGWNAV